MDSLSEMTKNRIYTQMQGKKIQKSNGNEKTCNRKLKAAGTKEKQHLKSRNKKGIYKDKQRTASKVVENR
jgi:hypothetical protein